MLDVAVEDLLIGCLKVPFTICVINLLALFLATVELVFMFAVVFGKADVFWNHYLTCVVQLGRRRSQTHKLDLKYREFSVNTLAVKLKRGKLKYLQEF